MERKEQNPRVPLGEKPYKVALSREEINLVHQVRLLYGVPMQTWIRRVIREQAQKELQEPKT